MTKHWITGVHHIALHPTTPEQFDKTLAFYCETLGCDTVRAWDTDGRRGAFLSAGNCILEVVLRDDGVQNDGALHHLALSTEDLEALLPRLAAAGYAITSGPRVGELPTNPPFRAFVAFCNGPCGETIEFFQELGEAN